MYEDADGLLKRIVTKAGGQPQSLERGLNKILVRMTAQDPPPT
jgi:hypothetical protein